MKSVAILSERYQQHESYNNHGRYMAKPKVGRKAGQAKPAEEVSVSAARIRLSELMNRTAYGSERFVIRKRGKVIAALVSAEDFEALDGAA